MDQEALEKEFTEKFDLYGDAIFRYSLVKVSNAQLAEDMTQEVFMRYWQYLRDGREITNARALLYTIANNMAKDWYKKKKADSLDDRMEKGGEPGEAAEQEGMAVYREVIEAIEDMDERDREVLILRFVEGFEPREIAEMQEESANVISVRINRATKRLKEALGYA